MKINMAFQLLSDIGEPAQERGAGWVQGRVLGIMKGSPFVQLILL